MKRRDFGRLIDEIFAAEAGEEMSCSDYFDQLPRYVELESSGEDAAALLPEVLRHMDKCPECEELYLGLLDILATEKNPAAPGKKGCGSELLQASSRAQLCSRPLDEKGGYRFHRTIVSARRQCRADHEPCAHGWHESRSVAAA